jgi:glycosyltransferase involved in cell wall biosynthesis
MAWHILDTGSIWLKEFAQALGAIVEANNWCPVIRTFGHWENWEQISELPDPRIAFAKFPLQRGYARFPISSLLPFAPGIVDRLLHRSINPESDTLLCTAPFYAPVAELWPGPVVYYLTDMTKDYAGMNANLVLELDRRMCRRASTVCPNSRRIAEYLCREAGCDPRKVTVIPNATRAQNVLSEPAVLPSAPPADIADLPRPIIGVIGNLASNMDWNLIEAAVSKVKNVSWTFVGPVDSTIADADQGAAREKLMRANGRVRFVGARPYGQLAGYARAFDVALLPYKRREPTYSGSATRFYEHLAACRPILSSRGFHELLAKEPLLKLVDTPEEISAEVETLRASGFRDGLEEMRWRASHDGTWQVRARDLVAAFHGSTSVPQ